MKLRRRARWGREFLAAVTGIAAMMAVLITPAVAADAAPAAAVTPVLRAGHFVLANFGIDQGWRVDSHPRFLVDITGDQRADIIGFGNQGVFTAVSAGDGGFI